jgi:hypothetical protein
LTEKRYIHKSEIKTILKGEIDGHQCEIYEKTGLPKGMIEGTTEQNLVTWTKSRIIRVEKTLSGQKVG